MPGRVVSGSSGREPLFTEINTFIQVGLTGFLRGGGLAAGGGQGPGQRMNLGASTRCNGLEGGIGRGFGRLSGLLVCVLLSWVKDLGSPCPPFRRVLTERCGV